MGCIISNIEEIDSIRWTELRKGRVTRASRVLRLDDQAVLIELENGTFTVAGIRHSPNGNWAVLGYGLDRFTGGVLDGLVRLGILTKAQVQDHKKRQQERKEDRDRKFARKQLATACETLGIEIPEAAE